MDHRRRFWRFRNSSISSSSNSVFERAGIDPRAKPHRARVDTKWLSGSRLPNAMPGLRARRGLEPP